MEKKDSNSFILGILSDWKILGRGIFLIGVLLFGLIMLFLLVHLGIVFLSIVSRNYPGNYTISLIPLNWKVDPWPAILINLFFSLILTVLPLLAKTKIRVEITPD